MKIWKEKWNYKPIFIGNVSDQTKDAFALPVIIELYGVSSLPFNELESNLISKILKINKRLFQMNEIKPIIVNKEQIVILSQDDFKMKIADNETENGKCSNGYIYVCRNNDISVFLNELSHALSHLLSFYSLAIKEEDKIRHINVRQSGCSNLWKKYYDGLNEAVTELWSKVILREFFRIYPNILSEKEKDIALNYYGYPYHATLIEEIIYNLVDNNVLVWPLFKSYFFGSSDFFIY
jgi:hypothetical protein